MKRILLALLVTTVSIGAVALNTRAAWTDTVTVTNNVITTGTVDLKVSTDNVPGPGTWNSTSAVSGMTLANLVPGGAPTEAYSFSLWNDSTGITTMTLTGQITASSITPGPAVDESQLMIELYDIATGVEVSEISLAAWKISPQALTNTLVTSATKDYGIRARLLNTALNEWQGKTVEFTLTVEGSQP